MADNLILAQILTGIAALTNVADIKMVLASAKEHKKVLTEKRNAEKPKKPRVRRNNLTMEDKIALAQGNSAEMIIKNEELYDFRLVLPKDLLVAKKWFNAPKPATVCPTTELYSAYHNWSVWNAPNYTKGYRGNAIMERATGLSPVAADEEEDDGEVDEEEDDDEAGVDDENEKMRKDLAALRLVVKEQGWNVD
jgi:hypothetical protein